MIRIIALNNGLEITQRISKPTVYLDNWGFNLFAQNIFYGDRFIQILNEKSGTLCVSLINMLEIIKRTDEKQKYQIYKFLDSLDLFLIESNPAKVIRKEKSLLATHNNDAFKAAADDLINVMGIFTYSPFTKFTVSNMLKKMDEQSIAKKVTGNFESILNPIINVARQDYKKIESAKSKFRQAPIGSNRPYTNDIYQKCFQYVAINGTMKMPEKEWNDVLHTVVPVAYCDYVLIDKRWANLVNNLGLNHPDIARVYTRNQLNEFLLDLQINS